MKVIRFFARNARSRLLFAVAAAVVSGFSSMVLLVFFTHVLKGGSYYSTITFACVLLALCVFLPLTSFISEAILARLTQGELFNLRMQLGRRILQAALRHLEMLGPARVMTAFSDDIPRIVEALNRVPRLCLNMAIVLSGLFYLGWLSWRVLLLVLLFFVLGLLVYELPSIGISGNSRAARRELDVLFGHFKDLTEGVKELKLHSRRRRVFLSEVLFETAASRSRHLVEAFHFHAIANSLGQMLVFILIGLLLFASGFGRSGMAAAARHYYYSVYYKCSAGCHVNTAGH